MNWSNFKKNIQKKFKTQEDSVKAKTLEQEKSLLFFAKFICLKSSVEQDYSNSLSGILRSLGHVQIDGMGQVESSLENEVELHTMNSQNLSHCSESIQAQLLHHRTKAMISSAHLSKQQSEINSLIKKCEVLEKSFKRSKTLFESNRNKLTRRKSIFNKVKLTFQRNSTANLSSHIVGESWNERNAVETICSKYLISLTEAYTRFLLLGTMDLRSIHESINSAFISIVETYLSICVKDSYSKNMEQTHINNFDEKISPDCTIHREFLSKLEEIYNYYYTFCLKGQSSDLTEQLNIVQNKISGEEIEALEKSKEVNSEQLRWRILEIRVAKQVLNIQKKLVQGELSPSEIAHAVQNGIFN